MCFNLYKTMLILRNFSKHYQIKTYTKTHQTAPHFQNFLGEANIYTPEPTHSICVQL